MAASARLRLLNLLPGPKPSSEGKRSPKLALHDRGRLSTTAPAPLLLSVVPSVPLPTTIAAGAFAFSLPFFLDPQDALAVEGQFGILEGRSFALIHPIAMGGLFFYTLWAGYLGWQWRRVRTIQDEINELKKQVAPAAAPTPVPVGTDGGAPPPPPSAAPAPSPVESKIQQLTEERKALLKGSYRDRHFNAGSILLGFGVLEAVAGCLNTWFRTGKLFPGPHLFSGAGITVLWALAASLVPAMQKGSETARNLHIALNTVNVLLFIWQIPTGIEIVYKDGRMIVSITGATGFIGRRLIQKLLSDNHKVCVLTRSRAKAQLVFPVDNFPEIVIAEEAEWKQCIHSSNAVVNLAGLPISTRWSPEIKKEIKHSRLNTTSKVVDLINNASTDLRPSVLVSATAIGYYGTSETRVCDENSPSGNDYLSEVCREWEAKALEVDNGVRLVLIRIGVVLGKDGGALAKMIPLFMMFAGGPLGSGRQWFSWIHLDDLVNLIYEALRNPSYKGIINGTAPNPVKLSEMCEQLGRVIGRPSWLPVPEFALKAALGEGASVVLEGQRVLPLKAQELGFSYKYPYVKDALRAIMRES